jgi:Flp pilus assembly pilin Flp
MEQRRAPASESGQTTAEYAVIVTMITIGIVVAFMMVGNTAAGIITQAASAV